jgi:hypothetical protein
MLTNTKKTTSEHEIVSDVLSRLRAKGVKACQELPLLGRCVDLAYIDEMGLITFEFKIKDWKRAIRQARDHQLGANFSYICLLERNVTPRLIEELTKTGVGLAFYRDVGEWPFEIVITAERSRETWSEANKALHHYIAAHYA